MCFRPLSPRPQGQPIVSSTQQERGTQVLSESTDAEWAELESTFTFIFPPILFEKLLGFQGTQRRAAGAPLRLSFPFAHQPVISRAFGVDILRGPQVANDHTKYILVLFALVFGPCCRTPSSPISSNEKPVPRRLHCLLEPSLRGGEQALVHVYERAAAGYVY